MAVQPVYDLSVRFTFPTSKKSPLIAQPIDSEDKIGAIALRDGI
jgi:hypothetical protein